jgi:uncharacterized UBP type Zn finger protein
MRIDPLIASHLEIFGINISAQAKTEKSIAELVRNTWIFVLQ